LEALREDKKLVESRLEARVRELQQQLEEAEQAAGEKEQAAGASAVAQVP
jgi:hypothetical protein